MVFDFQAMTPLIKNLEFSIFSYFGITIPCVPAVFGEKEGKSVIRCIVVLAFETDIQPFLVAFTASIPSFWHKFHPVEVIIMQNNPCPTCILPLSLHKFQDNP